MQNNHDKSFDTFILLTVVTIFLLIYVFYFNFSIITTPWLWSVKFNLMLNDLFNLSSKEDIAEIRLWVSQIKPHYVTWEQMKYVNGIIGDSVRYIYPALILGLFLYARAKYKRENHKLYTLEELIKQESKVWPHNVWIAKFNPHDTDWENGENRYREHPVRWAKKHKILLRKEDGTYALNVPRKTAKLKEQLSSPLNKMEDILTQSLGYKMLLLICLLRVDKYSKKPVLSHKEHKFASFLKHTLKIPPLVTEKDWNFYFVNYLVLSEKLIKSRRASFENDIDQTLKKLLTSENAKDIFRRHAFPETYLIKAIINARVYGILAGAVYPYLQPLDSKVFFILSDTGYNRFSIDTSGIFSHFKAEEAIKHRLEQKYVDGALVKEALVDRGLLDEVITSD